MRAEPEESFRSFKVLFQLVLFNTAAKGVLLCRPKALSRM